jgi:hypothetical protein
MARIKTESTEIEFPSKKTLKKLSKVRNQSDKKQSGIVSIY